MQNPYRVFFYVRETGTHTETWKFPGLPFDFEPTNKPILTAPSVYSVIWTPERKVQYASFCTKRNCSKNFSVIVWHGLWHSPHANKLCALCNNCFIQPSLYQ